MSALWIRISSWPLVTVSPMRAWISTTRPEASEITGMFRDTSGLTDPVTVNSGASMRSPAVTSGNCSGWSTLTSPVSSSCSTAAGGGAVSLALASTLFPHPPRNRVKPRQTNPVKTAGAAFAPHSVLHEFLRRQFRFIGSPLGPLPDSIELAAVKYEPIRFM